MNSNNSPASICPGLLSIEVATDCRPPVLRQRRPHGDAARLLPVLRLAPLRPQAQLDPRRSPATLGARPATPRSTTADQLGVFERSTVVRAAVSSYIASSGMKRRSSQKSSGEPSAGNLHAGFCLG